MTLFESAIWYTSDFLSELANFLMQEPFNYIVGLAILFFITGIVKRLT